MSRVTRIVRQRQARAARASRGTRLGLRLLAGGAAWLALSGILLTAVTGTVAAGTVAYFTADLPSVDRLETAFGSDNAEFFQTTQIFDRTGEHLLYEVIDPRGGDRQWLSIDPAQPRHISQAVIDATVAIEDKTFWTNPGYDLEGILRALISNLRGRSIQGGSTITQQLVKNTLIPPTERTQRTVARKMREILLAQRIAQRYSKEQVLEWYLNTNFYGNLAYGIDAAALVYFGKHATDLTLAESAMLAAIPQSPLLNPIDAPQEARERQALVLDSMVRQGYVSVAEADAAKAQPLTIQTTQRRFHIRAPHFAIWVHQQLVGRFGEDVVNRSGLRVITSLDFALQHQAECVVRTQIERLSGADPAIVVPASDGSACVAAEYLPPVSASDAGSDHHVSNAAVVVIHPATGEVLALVGSPDYWNESIDGSFNVAVDGLRQPGSSFKPFTYLTGFSQGYTPATMVLDVRRSFVGADGRAYVPENYDRRFHGPVRLRVALQRSYNVPAVDLTNRVGVENVIRTAHHMGIDTLDQAAGHYGLAITLGGGEVTLLDMTYAYGVIANSGTMAGVPVPEDQRRSGYRLLDPITILRVEDRHGNVLYEPGASQTQPVLTPGLAYLMQNVMSDEQARWAAFGHPSPLELGRPAGAKTGTTDDFRDNWTVGFTPQRVAGVWVGNSDNSPMEHVTGLTGAAPIWHAVMRYAHESAGLPPDGWTKPDGIVELNVCDPSGLLPTATCPTIVREVFIAGTEPTAYDNLYQAFQVNRETGKLATVYTPPELVEERVYMVLPPEADDWVLESGLPQPPKEYDSLYGLPEQSGDVAILEPAPFAYVRGMVTIRGNAKGDGFAFFRVQGGPGLNPSQWVQIGGDRGETIDRGDLQVWDTAGLDGIWTIQLVVVKQDQSFVTSTIQVTVDNQAPTVTLLSPEPGATYSRSQDESVVLQPDVRDNLSISRVEFYVDGQLVQTMRVSPYSTRWRLGGPGTHRVWVRAVDAAGNSRQTEAVTFEVTP